MIHTYLNYQKCSTIRLRSKQRIRNRDMIKYRGRIHGIITFVVVTLSSTCRTPSNKSSAIQVFFLTSNILMLCAGCSEKMLCQQLRCGKLNKLCECCNTFRGIACDVFSNQRLKIQERNENLYLLKTKYFIALLLWIQENDSAIVLERLQKGRPLQEKKTAQTFADSSASLDLAVSH